MHTTIVKPVLDLTESLNAIGKESAASPITLAILRRMKKAMRAMEVVVFFHQDLEPDVRDLPGFTPVKANGYPGYDDRLFEQEIGQLERMRFVYHPALPSWNDASNYNPALCDFYESHEGKRPSVYPVVMAHSQTWLTGTTTMLAEYVFLRKLI